MAGYVGQQETQDWHKQGYAPDDMELWDMLCGYLWLHQGTTYQVWLPKVVYPLVLDAPRTQAVRRWFGEHDALPIELLPQARVALVSDWRE